MLQVPPPEFHFQKQYHKTGRFSSQGLPIEVHPGIALLYVPLIPKDVC